MATPVAVWTDSFRRQLEHISAALAEGVILLDLDQSIRWANAAALAMHGVDKVESLGRTMGEYHANFQIKYRNSAPPAKPQPAAMAGVDAAFGDLVIEVTPLSTSGDAWHYRMRNLVLTDDASIPACIALILQPMHETTASDERFFSAKMSVPPPAAILRLIDETFVEANGALLRFAGLSRDEIVSRPLQAVDVFANSADMCDAMKRIVRANRPATAISEFVDAHHYAQPVLIVAMPIELDSGAGMLLTFTQPAGAGQSPALAPVLAGPAHDAAVLCAAAPVPLVALDADMRIMRASEAFGRWLGYNAAEIIGRKITEFQVPASEEHFTHHVWADLLEAGSSREMECRFIKRAGTQVDAQISLLATFGEDSRFRFATLAAAEITDQKRQEERFTKMFNASPVPLIVAKMDDSRVLEVNEAFLTATGHDPVAVIGHRVDELGLFETRGLRNKYDEDMRRAGQVRGMDVKLRSAAAGQLDCILAADQIWAFGQKCVLLTLQDVTERRMNEAQLFQAIEAVMKDSAWFSRSVIEKLAVIRSPTKPGARAAEIGHLTKREHEVLVLISHGLTDNDIAAKLGLTRCTVRNHVATLYGKIDVHSRSSAIVWARERGLNLTRPQVVAAPPSRPALPTRPAGLQSSTRRAGW